MGNELSEELSASRIGFDASKLSGEELLDGLKRCVMRDRQWTARMLIHMGEVDARKLYRDQGHSSMFAYAVRVLHMSEAEAGLRITAARFGREHPRAIEMLARGELHMSAMCVLSSVLTAETIGLLEQARFKSKKEVEELRAMHFPKPDVPTLHRQLPARTGRAPAMAQQSSATLAHASEPKAVVMSRSEGVGQLVCASDSAATGECVGPTAPCTAGSQVMHSPLSADAIAAARAMEREQEHGLAATAVQAGILGGAVPDASTAESAETRAVPQAPAFRLEPPVETVTMVPLSEGRTLLRITASRRWGEKLEQAKHLMRHQVPTGDPIAVLERALDLLIAERKKKLFGQTQKPKRTTPTPTPIPTSNAKRSRYIPRAVRREVAERDGEQCAFVAADGHRCAERGGLELDHHPIPFTRGGTSTADNLRLTCAAHNQLAAERAFGSDFIKERICAARSIRGASGSKRSASSSAAADAFGARTIVECETEGAASNVPLHESAASGMTKQTTTATPIPRRYTQGPSRRHERRRIRIRVRERGWSRPRTSVPRQSEHAQER